MKALDSSAAEIDALEALCGRLGGFDDSITLEWLDGCMAALLAGPRAVLPSQWLPKLLGDAWERAFADPQDVQQATDTLMCRWNVLASQLDAEALFDAPDELRLSPLMGDFSIEHRDALLAEGKLREEDLAHWPLTGEAWAVGVLSTIKVYAEDWIHPGADSDAAAWFQGCLRVLLALTIRDEAELQADLQLRYPGQSLSREDLLDEACIALQDLRCFWVEHAPRHAPRKVQPVPGRNDTCPCGSGKKYKKCHGAVAALS